MEGRLATSDHELIESELLLEIKPSQKSEFVRDYQRGEYIEMRRRMGSVQWTEELQSLGVEESWQFIKNELAGAIESLVPMKRNKSARATPWMDHEVKRAINNKKKAFLQKYRFKKLDSFCLNIG